jgi:hypothetical protein
MSELEQNAGMPTNDVADITPLDDPARAESQWLKAREHDPCIPAPSAKIANDYAELERLLGDLPAPPDVGWRKEVLRRIASSASPPPAWWRKKLRPWALVGAVVAAAAVGVLALLPRAGPIPEAAELDVTTLPIGAMRRSSTEVVVGDHLVVRAIPRKPGDLRVYRSDGVLVARCPAGPGCKEPTHGEYSIEVRLDAPVQHQVILVVGQLDVPLDVTMDAFLDAATAANARVVRKPINVRP